MELVLPGFGFIWKLSPFPFSRLPLGVGIVYPMPVPHCSSETRCNLFGFTNGQQFLQDELCLDGDPFLT
jgi:hypothetical protein